MAHHATIIETLTADQRDCDQLLGAVTLSNRSAGFGAVAEWR
jgi:hypothetical protein